ncbi:MAG: 50S ribosomal protein L1 [Proteobacteria bacterium]|nr:MAG: 50S ribosomal protein L1 [Pseudomonadota bacterium]
MAKEGKRYRKVKELVEDGKVYDLEAACEAVVKTASAKFDETVEFVLKLGVDQRKADQNVRGSVPLPHGLGKNIRVAVFAKGEKAEEAKQAGADIVGAEDLAEKIKGGFMDFDSVVATPDMMAQVGKVGKLLGPRGLMPSPKTGTIVPAEDLPRVINESRLGRVEFRVDKTSNIHVPIGKVSFSSDKLLQNFAALMEAVVAAKPAALKGNYIHRVTLASTMGPGVKTDVGAATALKADAV